MVTRSQPEPQPPESQPTKPRKSRSGSKRTSARGPSRAELYEVAWLHYELGYTQTAISKLPTYKCNKATISRWLAMAREERIVTIDLHPPGIEDLEVRMATSFGLRHSRVIPGLPKQVTTDPDLGLDPDDVYKLQMAELGKAAAQLLGPRLKGNMGIGLAGGRGGASFGRHLVKHCAPVPLTIYSLGASSLEPFAFGATSVAASTTQALVTGFEDRAAHDRAAGKPTAIPPVKGFALRLPEGPDGAENNDILAKRYYDEAMNNIHHVVAGVGGINSSYAINKDQKARLAREGAIGEVVYDVYGLGATPIQLDASEGVYSFGIDRLRTIVNKGRDVTLICKDKIDAIYELLVCESRIVTGIVTDAPTAKKLLKRYDQNIRARR